MNISVIQSLKQCVVIERDGDFFKISKLINRDAYLMINSSVFRNKFFKYPYEFENFFKTHLPSDVDIRDAIVTEEAQNFFQEILNYNRIEY